MAAETGEREEGTAECAALFRQQYGAVVQTVFRVLGSQLEAEEIAAETFAKLFQQKTNIANPAGWLRRCALRAALDALRASSRRRRREEHSQRAARVPPTPEELLGRKELQERVRSVLADLPARDAELLLVRFDGSSYLEIAEQCGIQASSVGTLLARAEKNFKAKYEERYGIE